jgi:hypothetical protein
MTAETSLSFIRFMSFVSCAPRWVLPIYREAIPLVVVEQTSPGGCSQNFPVPPWEQRNQFEKPFSEN